MSLTEIMQNADLTLYPKVGLIIFAGVFVLVCYRTLRMTRHTDVNRLGRLALEDDTMAPGESDNTGGAA